MTMQRFTRKRYDYDVAVIGAGSGGLTVAVGAHKLGLKTALIEGHLFGGDCLNFGCIPSKALISAAKVAHTIRQASRYGIHCDGGEPRAEWNDVQSHITSVQAKIREHENADYFRKMGMSVFEEYASFEDSHTLQAGSERLTARYIVIATGSHPAVPPLKNLQETGFVTNETVFSIPDLPRRLLGVGAGPIGCELAQAFGRLGSQITMMDNLNRILDKEDEDMASSVAEQFREEGIEIVCGAKVLETSRTADGEKLVHYEIDGEARTYSCDEILIATGRRPNIDRLNLEAAGISTERGAIQTDSHMRTSQRHVYAIGDVTGGLQFTHMASQQAGVVIRHMIFGISARNSIDAFPWVTYTDPELASVGYNEQRAEAAGIRYEVAKADLGSNDRALTAGEIRGRIKVLSSSGRIIGAQILGPHAGELIPEYVMAISRKMSLRDFSSFTHAYPTLAEINRKVALDALSPALFNDRVRKTLRAVFGFRGDGPSATHSAEKSA